MRTTSSTRTVALSTSRHSGTSSTWVPFVKTCRGRSYVMHVCMCVFLCLFVCVCVCVYMSIYVCVCVCECMCMCVSGCLGLPHDSKRKMVTLGLKCVLLPVCISKSLQGSILANMFCLDSAPNNREITLCLVCSGSKWTRTSRLLPGERNSNGVQPRKLCEAIWSCTHSNLQQAFCCVSRQTCCSYKLCFKAPCAVAWIQHSPLYHMSAFLTEHMLWTHMSCTYLERCARYRFWSMLLPAGTEAKRIAKSLVCYLLCYKGQFFNDTMYPSLPVFAVVRCLCCKASREREACLAYQAWNVSKPAVTSMGSLRLRNWVADLLLLMLAHWKRGRNSCALCIAEEESNNTVMKNLWFP